MADQIKRLLSRRALIAGGAGVLSLNWFRGAHGQRNKSFVLGWLSSTPGPDSLLEAFHAGLRGLAYLEGSSIRVVARSARDNSELRVLARELVRQQVDVLVTKGRAATRAAQEATATIPVVMAPVDDPYELSPVCLARPAISLDLLCSKLRSMPNSSKF